MIRDFRDIKVWQKSHNLTLQIYKITKQFPKEEIYSLTSQMRRAASSVTANIVEGFSRRSQKDQLHFYNISDASLAELRYHVLLSFDLGYIDKEHFQNLQSVINEVGKMLNGWIQSQKS
ncbi:MAG: four helix bundle protein [Candidatus Roizmanbacteria bacterium]|nr:four helix bundle protein [Candidatus Roizmanbacteria bacterium]